MADDEDIFLSFKFHYNRLKANDDIAVGFATYPNVVNINIKGKTEKERES